MRRVRNLVDLFEAGAPGADTNITGAQVTIPDNLPANTRLAYRVQFANSTTFRLVIARPTANPVPTPQNSLALGGATLTGGAPYEFEFTLKPGEQVDHQITVDGAIAYLTIDEILEGGDA
jgi:hypothetical protein